MFHDFGKAKHWPGGATVTVFLVVTIVLIAWKVSHDVRVMRGPTESELKAHLTESGRLAELEAWAMTKIGQPPEMLEGDAQPPESEEGRVLDAEAVLSDEGMIQCIALRLGSGFRHRGLLIGNIPDKHMFAHRYSNQWSDRVVYYDARPQE